MDCSLFAWEEKNGRFIQCTSKYNVIKLNTWYKCFSIIRMPKRYKIHGHQKVLVWLLIVFKSSSKFYLLMIKSHRCPQDNKTVWFSMFLLEAEHLHERKGWADISIQNKESLWTPGDNLISEVIDAPSSAQGCVLLQVPAVQSQDEQQACSHSALDVHHGEENNRHLYGNH